MEKNGGRPKKETIGFEENKTIGFSKEKTKTKPNVNENVNDNVNENDNDNDNGIYLSLFNIYNAKILEEPKRTIQIISELQNSEDYNSLTIEEQDKLFEDLMNPQKRELL